MRRIASYRAQRGHRSAWVRITAESAGARDASSQARWCERKVGQRIGMGVGETRFRAWVQIRAELRNALPIPREDVPRSGLQLSEVPPPFQTYESYYCRAGSMISAKELRARFRRDFTVPRLQCVISAISS